MVAWSVEIDSMSCVVFAATAAKARYVAVRAYWEAGYGSRRTWPRAVAWREPRFDASPLKARPNNCYCREYVQEVS